MEKQFNPSGISNETIIEIKKEQEKHYKLIGSITVPPGLKLWKYNNETGEMKEVHRTPLLTADFIAAKEHKSSIAEKRSKAQYDPFAIYIIALNEKNAYKKLLKMVSTI